MSEHITSHRVAPAWLAVTSLDLPSDRRVQIECWSAEGYPNEACGLLLGRVCGTETQVVHVRRARNLNAERARDRYELDPVDHVAIETEARVLGLDVVGAWHSHPDHPARPSETDLAGADASWSYVIVAVAGGIACDVRSWRLSGGQFAEETLSA